MKFGNEKYAVVAQRKSTLRPAGRRRFKSFRPLQKGKNMSTVAFTIISIIILFLVFISGMVAALYLQRDSIKEVVEKRIKEKCERCFYNPAQKRNLN